jgi:phosphate uptake regulator
MKRKILSIGQTALGITLPGKWHNQNHLKKGDEIDVEEDGSRLILHASANKKTKSTTLHLDKIKPFITLYLRSLARLGYDELILKYGDISLMEQVQGVLKDQLIGFEIISQEKEKAVIRCLSEAKEEEFDTTMRRNLLITHSMIEGLGEALDKKDLGMIKPILYLEEINNKLTSLCKRILIKTDYRNKDYSILYYSVLDAMEDVCDQLRFMCQYLLTDGKIIKEMEKDVVDFYGKLNHSFNLLKDNFFKTDVGDKLKLAAEYKYINKEMIFSNLKLSQSTFPVYHYIISIFHLLWKIFTNKLEIDEIRKLEG